MTANCAAPETRSSTDMNDPKQPDDQEERQPQAVEPEQPEDVTSDSDAVTADNEEMRL